MPVVINTNVSSLSAQRALGKNTAVLERSFQRLSTGLRINSAKDDAAGLAIASRFTAQVRGLNQAVRNANDGVSLAQTAEAALNEMTGNLQRLRELAVQSANDTNSASDRAALQAEADAIIAEIDRVAVKTNFNGRNVLDGSFDKAKFQIGANSGDNLEVSIKGSRTYSLGKVYERTLNLDDTTAAGDKPALGDITIEGEQIAAAVAGDDQVSYAATPADVAGSAIAIAAAINKSAGDSGVSAVVNSNTLTMDVDAATTMLATDTINGVAIFASTTSIADNDVGNVLRDAINAVSDNTGVVASSDGAGNITLEATDGRDIVLTGANWTDVTDTAAGTYRGSIALQSDDEFTVVTTADVGDLTTGTYNVTTASIDALSSLSLTTQTGADDAIKSVDAALRQVNSQQADLGAMLNRFESAISSMTAISENLAAARSRIQDADFAMETAEFTRNQILQQASSSILAQANVSGQIALNLLG